VKQVLQDRTGLTVVRDVPPPACGPGAVLVRNAFSVISSGTERARVETSRKSLLGKARARPDLVREVVDRARREGVAATRRAVQRKLSEETPVGYSSAGLVLEVGETVRGFSPGDLVACGGAGYANHAEIVSVPSNLCARVPAGVPLQVAAMTTISSIALHGVRLAGVQIGDRVAVIGCGLVGQIACRLLRAGGATVFALDVAPARAEQARAGGAAFASGVHPGAAAAVLSASGGTGVDAILVTAAASSNDPLLLAAEIARDRGAIVLVGDVPVDMPRGPLYEKELSFRVSRSYGPGRYDIEYEEHGIDYPIGYVRWTEQRNMECVLELQARAVIDLRDLVEIEQASRAAEAYARLVGPTEQRPIGAIALSYDETDVALSLDTDEKKTLAVAVQEDEPTRKAVAQAPVRIGLIGPGNFALRVLVPAITAAGGLLETVGGGSGRSAEAAARMGGFARFSESPEAVIEDDNVDAVVIATHHGAHASLAKRALEADKHVFCEKPLALSMRELEEVFEAAASSRGILAVGFNRRFSPFLRAVREFVAPGTAPVVATYRVSAGSIPPEHWVHDLERGGGRILGEVCHFVDSLTFVVGAPVIDVYGAGYGQLGTPLQARDNVAITLRFANRSVAAIIYAADGSRHVPKERLEVFSGSRTAILDDYRHLELLAADKSIRRNRAQDKGHREEIRAFLSGVAEGQPPVFLSEVANVSLATLATIESLRTGRSVGIDALVVPIERA
jgi:predicted dehydrogenase/threonine dehydrogenase-like Zn-dependent dehydrogenase